MSDRKQGVILYGYGVEAVAQALQKLDSRYVLVDRVAPESGQVPVVRCPHGMAADAVRAEASGFAWLVVELYRPEVEVAHAREPLLVLNTVKVDPGTAARAIDQPDLVTWYEVINAVRVVTVDEGPAANDYSNIAIVVPNGHKVVAHAVWAAGVAPKCLSGAAEQVLRSDDLWALAGLRETEVCPACTTSPPVAADPVDARD